MEENKRPSLEEQYQLVKKLIDSVDFSLLWEGFKPLRFALYNNEQCFFDGQYIEKTQEFIANTSINYKGEVIAIWNVMEDLDPVTLASKMIHEMFHGFQMLNKESRFPDELDALYNYKYSDENLSIKLEENKLIVSLLDNFNKDEFDKLLRLRKYRYSKYKYEYVYESKIEQIEGCANFVELNSLKQLSNELYIKKLDEFKKTILNKSNFLPIRVLCYNIGALLLQLLKDNNIVFEKGFEEESFSLSLIKDVMKFKPDVELSFDNDIDEYFKKADEIIDKAISKKDIVVEGENDILGVNVYNAIYRRGYIISIYFLMYGKSETPNIEYGNFVIETHSPKKLSKVYKY